VTLLTARCLSLALFATAVPAAAVATDIQEEAASAAAFYERAQAEYYEMNPEAAARLGLRVRYGEWNDRSEAGDLAGRELARRQLTELRATIDRDRLDDQGRLSWDLFADMQQRRIDGWRWRNHDYVFDHRSGPHSSAPAFLINTHRVESEADAEAYVSRLRGMLGLFASALERANRAEARGIMPPRWVFPQIVEGARNVVTGRPFDDGPGDSTLLADFRKKVGALDLPEERKDALLAAAERALLESVKPAYDAVIAWAGAAEGRASGDDGVWKLPHGAAYYDYLLARYTTTTLDADAIHELGLREVARLHADMRRVMRQVGFRGDLKAFFDHIREDDRFYYPDTEEGRAAYLAEATRLIDAMRAKLPELFRTLPRADVVVKAVEPFREASAGKAFYQRPPADGSKPGTYYVNLYRMRDMPKTEMEALAYHEGIPGHHMQLAIAQEMEELPMFRRLGFYTAYTEGWALYSERLPKEVGFYQDPYSEFGRLTLELIRAVRLVVDTGLHAKGWTRDQVVQYHLDNTPLPEGSAVRATERYVVMPGQATAYMVGQLRIIELRQRAERELGDRFDVRDFHDVVLRSGPLPLDILERRVEEWVTARGTRAPASRSR
jgi:uncharacterized protein (DUF885 family)